MSLLDRALEAAQRISGGPHGPEIVPGAKNEHSFELVEYMTMLFEWEAKNYHDLPPVPPPFFREAESERPLAWSAWWAAVKRARKKRNSGRGV